MGPIKNEVEWVNKLEAWSFLKFWKHHYEDVATKVEAIGNYIPHRSLWFKALELCPPDRVKVVILIEHPHFKKEHNHGLALSVPASVDPVPAQTRAFLNELHSTFGIEARNGDLSPLGERGVLLLNQLLTVSRGMGPSHSKVGWDKLIFEIIRHLSAKREGIVFVFIGAGAQEFSAAVDASKHCVIHAPHPSPLAAIGGDSFSSARVLARAYEYNPELGMDYWRL